MQKKQAIIITALIGVIIALVALTFARPQGGFWTRLDMTRNKAYTISEVSKSLYQEISDIVSITYYRSDKLLQQFAIPGEIEDLLEEYSQYSHGRIQYSAVDPSVAGISALMQTLGIESRTLQTGESNQVTVAMVYSGILIEYQGRQSVIPFIWALDSLEYDLTSRIRTLVRNEDRVVGILAANTAETVETNFATLQTFLQYADYTVQSISPGEDIPLTLKSLIVIGGVESLDSYSLYRIDYFIQSGGKVLFMVDPISIDQSSMQGAAKTDLGLLDMLRSYGAIVEPSLVLDESSLLTYISTGYSYQMVYYPFWLDVTTTQGNPESPITRNFTGLVSFWASPITLSPVEGLTQTPLYTSTPKAWLMSSDFYLNPNYSFMFETNKASTQGAQTLAVSLQGVFPSYFANQEKPLNASGEDDLPAMPATAQESRVVLIADEDMVGETWAGSNQSAAVNYNMMITIADWLGNDDDILTIRNRSGSTSFLNKITEQEKEDAVMAWVKALNVFVIPGLVLVALILALVLRRHGLRVKEQRVLPGSAAALAEPEDEPTYEEMAASEEAAEELETEDSEAEDSEASEGEAEEIETEEAAQEDGEDTSNDEDKN